MIALYFQLESGSSLGGRRLYLVGAGSAAALSIAAEAREKSGRLPERSVDTESSAGPDVT